MSIVDDIVERVGRRMADPDLLLLTGKRRRAQNAQKKRIVFVRQKGSLTATTSPDGVRVQVVRGEPQRTKKLFTRNEVISCLVSAEDEDELDELFDRFMCAVWNEFAPNVFHEPTEYEWANEDSEKGGAHLSSNPRIIVNLVFRFAVTDQPKRVVTVEQAVLQSTDLE